MISVRRMTVDDIAVSLELLRQLGYPLDTPELQRRYDAVAASNDHHLMVAERARRVAALFHVYMRPALDKPAEAIVQALVVDHAARGGGIGKIMMAAAEAWATDHVRDACIKRGANPGAFVLPGHRLSTYGHVSSIPEDFELVLRFVETDRLCPIPGMAPHVVSWADQNTAAG